jgi:osmotically-inducible protein OsmY
MEDSYPYNRERGDRDRHGRPSRGEFERAGDEVRSWFGDDEAARRRRMDEQERWRSGPSWGNERSYSSEREYGDGGYGWRTPREAPADPRVTYGRDDRPASGYAPYSNASYTPYSNDATYTEYGRQTYGGPYGRERYGAREWSSTEGWRVPGPHAGRGPRGYQRSDDRIREELNDRLTAHGHIDATDIECRVVNGEVTLTGFVDSRAAKRAAEDIADDLYGVREVHNQLRIRSHSSEGVGRTSVLGLTEAQAETAHPPTATAVDPGRPRTRG